MTTKYYLKEICKNCLGQPTFCEDCGNIGFTRGADVIELIKRKVDITDTAELNLWLSDCLDLIEVVQK